MAGAKAQKKVDTGFDAVFDRLRAILVRHAKGLAVKEDSPVYYYLETMTPAYHGKPVMFGAVRKGKAYVSFHLIPVYAYPELLKAMSPALRKRMQGKSCFNFTEIDEPLFEELERLTATSAKGFSEKMAALTPGAMCP
jgi:hypothetical protein